MSYSVNFHEDPTKPGNILLQNVVMNGKIYTPNGVTEVFTNDDTGNLMINKALVLSGITYTSPGASTSGAPGPQTTTTSLATVPVATVPVETATTSGAPGPQTTTTSLATVPVARVPVAPGVVPGLSGAKGTPPPPTPLELALAKAKDAILVAITTAEEYKNSVLSIVSGGSTITPPLPVTTLDPAIKAVDPAIAAVDTAIKTDPTIESKYEETKKKLDAINNALAKLKDLLKSFNSLTPLTEESKKQLEKAINDVKVEHDKLFGSPTTGGAPLRFGSPSSKTKRNRRRNRRFAKKSYKRRH